MKRIITWLFFIANSILMYAQNNVGINTTSPQASLDIRGSQRVGGINNYTMFDSATGRIQWIGAALYAPASQQIIRHSASSEGLYAGGGRLEYRNVTSTVFYSDWTNGNGYFRNNLGINNLTPQFPLSFNGALGDKISLWTDGTATHYGLGIQSGLLQIFSKTNVDDIAFGYGSSGSFTERMRIKGNGNVGIGVSDPSFKLDISDRMRIRSGGGFSSAGLYFNRNDNSNVGAFAGMQDDAHVGFWGNPSGWAFTMNTNTGALAVNGNEGANKQVLSSTGSSSSWQTLGSLIQTFYRYAPGLQAFEGNVSSATPSLTLSAISQTITVNVKSRLIITASFAGNIVCTGVCTSGGSAIIDMRVNGTEAVAGVGGLTRLNVPVNAFDYATIPNYFYDVNPGTYTIEFFTQGQFGASFQLWSIYSTIIALPID